MKLIVNTNCKLLVVNVTDKTGALLSSLSDCFLATQEWSNHDLAYKPAGTLEKPEGVGILFVADNCFVPPTPMMDDLNNTLKASEKRWLEYYTRATKAENELEELKKKATELNTKQEETKKEEEPF